MRIISGTARGRRLFTPARSSGEAEIRPTSDKVRGAIFNILSGSAEGVAVLDLFAGTGAMGIESLSRGCTSVTFVDRTAQATSLIKKNLEICGFSDRATVLRRDLLKSPFFFRKIKPDGGFGIIFLDPPYRRGITQDILKVLGEMDLLAKDGILIAEEAAGVDLPEIAGPLRMYDNRLYGDTAIFFYAN